jgi:uncharacterized membrane protein
MDRTTLSLYVLSIAVVVMAIWINFFLPIKIDVQAIPTLVNGITSSTSIIIAVLGVIIGIMFREMDRDDQKAKDFYVTAMLVLVIPLGWLFTTYLFLTTGYSQFAIKYGLIGLIFVLDICVIAIVYTAKRLSPETKKEKV